MARHEVQQHGGALRRENLLRDEVDDGGYWVKIGTYDMKAGDYYAVRLSSSDGSGRAVADAVVLVRGVTSLPPNDVAPADGGRLSPEVTLDATFSPARLSGRVKGRRLIRRGRWHIGTPYRLSPPAPCSAYEKEDCSCFTKMVFRHFKWVHDSPVMQFQYGHKVRSRFNLRRGDLVFFKESGRRASTAPVRRARIGRYRTGALWNFALTAF